MSANEAKGRLLESGVEAKVSSRLGSVQAIDRAEGERYGGGKKNIRKRGDKKRSGWSSPGLFRSSFFFFFGRIDDMEVGRFGGLLDRWSRRLSARFTRLELI